MPSPGLEKKTTTTTSTNGQDQQSGNAVSADHLNTVGGQLTEKLAGDDDAKSLPKLEAGEQMIMLASSTSSTKVASGMGMFKPNTLYSINFNTSFLDLIAGGNTGLLDLVKEEG